VQQVTADLYGIFLVIFSSKFRASAITDISVRGSYNAPHRFLRFGSGNTYWPLVPDLKRPSEYRFPKITLEDTQGKIGIPNNLAPENDGLLHPWRTPLPHTSVPEKLCPIPITTLGPIQTSVLETVLWITFKEDTGNVVPKDPATINPSPGIVMIEPTTEFNSKPSSPKVPSYLLSLNFSTKGPGQQGQLSHVDYFRIRIIVLKQIALERQIDISSTHNISNQEIRRERIAGLIERWEEEQEAAFQTIPPLSEGVWKELQGQATAMGLNSVPTGIQALCSSTKAKLGSPKHPFTRLVEMSHNSDGYSKRVLMGIGITLGKNREENFQKYQEWTKAQMA
jgi:hypothetical protein